MGPAAQRQPVDFGGMLQKLSRGDQILLGGSLLLLIDSFISAWLHASYDCPSTVPSGLCGLGSASGETLYHGWGFITFIALLAIIAFFVIRKFLVDQVQLPELPLPDWQIYMALGAVEILGIILFWLEYKQSADSAFGGYSLTFGWAWFVGLVAAAATIYGGYLKQNDPQTMASASTGGYVPPPMPPTPPTTPMAPPPPPPPPSMNA
jgi:hypothetical protein